MNALTTGDPGRRRLIAAAAAALRVHPSSDVDATDAAVLARRVDASADAIAANTRGRSAGVRPAACRRARPRSRHAHHRATSPRHAP